MEEKELRERLTELAKARGFVCEAPSGKVKDLQLTFNQKELVELIDQEVDKARKEGRKNILEEIKESMESYLEDDTTTYDMVVMLLAVLKTKEDEKQNREIRESKTYEEGFDINKLTTK